MPLIFIDANAWLGFWKVADGRLKGELLPATISLAPYLFIPGQVAFEVERQKLNCFLTTVPFTQPKLPMALPEHLLAGADAAKWQKERNALSEEFKRLEGEWRKSVDAIADEISRSEDATTRALKPVLDAAVPETEDQLARARLRRERGHPPGKPKDTLGDQISWEQILDAAKGQEVWLVSDDNDFSVRTQNGALLNSYLRRELAERGAVASVFRTLADMINAAEQSKLGVRDAPPAKRLSEIANEEKEASRQIPFVGYGSAEGPCPQCARKSLIGPAARPGPFGFAWYSTCTNCGALIFVDDYCD